MTIERVHERESPVSDDTTCNEGSIAILHIDDDQDFRDLVSDTIQRNGERIELFSVGSVEEALDILEREPIECLITDHHLPGTDGLTFIRRLRDQGCSLPSILFTGKGSENIAGEAISAGVDDYLRKGGIDKFDLLVNKIEHLVDKHRAERRADHYHRINEVVRSVHRTLVRSHSCETMLESLCDIISRSEAYSYCWVGRRRENESDIRVLAASTVTSSTSSVVDRAVVRPHSLPHEQVASVSAGDGRRIHTFDVSTRDAEHDWLPQTESDGIRGLAVPITFNAVDYGTLFIYAERTNGFLREEVAILDSLATDVAHAIDAVEKTRDLKANRDRLESITRALPDLAVVLSHDGICLEVLADGPMSWLTDEQGLEGYPITDLLPSDVCDRLINRIQTAIDVGEVTSLRFERKTGTERRWYEVHIAPLTYGAGNSDGVVATIRDVTELKRRELEARSFWRAVEHAGHSIYRTDLDGTIKYVNPAFERISGYSSDEVIGETPSLFKSGLHDEEYYSTLWKRILDGQVWEGEVINRRKDGKLYTINQTIAPVHGPDGDLEEFVAINTDVTHRKQLRETLREQRDRFHALFKTVPEPVVEMKFQDGDPIVTNVNPAFENVFGFERTEIIGENLDECIVPPDRTDEADRLNQRGIAGEPVEVEVTRRTTQGVREFLLCTAHLADDEEHHRSYAIYLDISELKRRERELKRKNERLDTFAALVSHDLRNPLNVALGGLDLYRTTGEAEQLDRTERALDRMATIIKEMLSMARNGQSEAEFDTISLEAIAHEAWSVVEGPATALSLEIGDDEIRGDPDRVQTLFENLFRNAIDHGGDDVTIVVERTQSGIAVEDDGPGFSRDDVEDLFKPGFTTNPDGTGCGLAIVKQVVDDLGWAISATEGRSGGARFEIEF